MSPHGTESRYVNTRCRCGACTDAASAASLARQHRRAAWPRETVPHGTVNGYRNYGCRCEACTEAHRVACLRTRAFAALDEGRPLTAMQAAALASP
jgi:hypothetical protein